MILKAVPLSVKSNSSTVNIITQRRKVQQFTLLHREE